MIPIDTDHAVGDVLLSRGDIAGRIAEMATGIDADLAGADQIVVIGVLKGAAFFTADLARALQTPALVTYTTISSYGWKALESEGPRMTSDTDIDVKGRHVLVVEDIIDSGRTLAMLRDHLTGLGAASVRIAVLLDLRNRAQDRILKPDFVGFESSATWVCGYGIDYKEHYRNLPDIRRIERPSV